MVIFLLINIFLPDYLFFHYIFVSLLFCVIIYLPIMIFSLWSSLYNFFHLIFYLSHDYSSHDYISPIFSFLIMNYFYWKKFLLRFPENSYCISPIITFFFLLIFFLLFFSVIVMIFSSLILLSAHYYFLSIIIFSSCTIFFTIMFFPLHVSLFFHYELLILKETSLQFPQILIYSYVFHK